MPYQIRKTKGSKYRVTGPSGTHAKGTTKKKAAAQKRLLQAVEHGFQPAKAKKRRKRA